MNLKNFLNLFRTTPEGMFDKVVHQICEDEKALLTLANESYAECIKECIDIISTHSVKAYNTLLSDAVFMLKQGQSAEKVLCYFENFKENLKNM